MRISKLMTALFIVSSLSTQVLAQGGFKLDIEFANHTEQPIVVDYSVYSVPKTELFLGKKGLSGNSKIYSKQNQSSKQVTGVTVPFDLLTMFGAVHEQRKTREVEPGKYAQTIMTITKSTDAGSSSSSSSAGDDSIFLVVINAVNGRAFTDKVAKYDAQVSGIKASVSFNFSQEDNEEWFDLVSSSYNNRPVMLNIALNSPSKPTEQKQ